MIHYIKVFCQRTSIRGIPKVGAAKKFSVKWFWIFFVLLSFIALMVVITFLIQRYLRYDTIYRSSTSSSTNNDFPQVTICSKRFFNLPYVEAIYPYSYLDNFTSEVYTQGRTFLTNNDVPNALLVFFFEYVTTRFFQENFPFIRDRTFALVNSLNDTCRFIKNGYSWSESEPSAYCDIKAVFNPSYLNCLAFSLPRNYSGVANEVSMQIVIPFARRTDNSTIDTLHIDEYQSDLVATSLYQPSRLFIHAINEYPFDSTYDTFVDCSVQNVYSVGTLNQVLYPVINGSIQNCLSTPPTLNSYSVNYSPILGTLCQNLIMQSAVESKCKCLMLNLATNDTSFYNMRLCSADAKSSQCASDLLTSLQSSVPSLCLRACKLVSYNVQAKPESFFTTQFSAVMAVLLNDVASCLKMVGNQTSLCCTYMKNAILYEFPTISRFSCPTISPAQTVKVPAQPNNPTCGNLSLIVQLQPTKNIQVATLVVDLNGLLSQIAGMCAFITGFTLAFVAEVTEVFLIWWSEKKANSANSG